MPRGLATSISLREAIEWGREGGGWNIAPREPRYRLPFFDHAYRATYIILHSGFYIYYGYVRTYRYMFSCVQVFAAFPRVHSIPAVRYKRRRAQCAYLSPITRPTLPRTRGHPPRAPPSDIRRCSPHRGHFYFSSSSPSPRYVPFFIHLSVACGAFFPPRFSRSRFLSFQNWAFLLISISCACNYPVLVGDRLGLQAMHAGRFVSFVGYRGEKSG